MTLSREEHLKIAAEQRRLGLGHLALAHERAAERADYEIRTTLDLPDGEQVDVDVGFDLEPRQRQPFGAGSPDIPEAVAVVWVRQLNGTPLDFDGMSREQQQQLTGACWYELDGRNR